MQPIREKPQHRLIKIGGGLFRVESKPQNGDSYSVLELPDFKYISKQINSVVANRRELWLIGKDLVLSIGRENIISSRAMGNEQASLRSFVTMYQVYDYSSVSRLWTFESRQWLPIFETKQVLQLGGEAWGDGPQGPYRFGRGGYSTAGIELEATTKLGEELLGVTAETASEPSKVYAITKRKALPRAVISRLQRGQQYMRFMPLSNGMIRVLLTEKPGAPPDVSLQLLDFNKQHSSRISQERK